MPTKPEGDGQAKKCLLARVGIAHLSLRAAKNLHCAGNCWLWSPLILSVEMLWKQGLGAAHCWLRIAGEGTREEGIPDVTPSPQSCSFGSKTSEPLHAPRVLIWHLFLRQGLQKASPLLWGKPARGPGRFCWLRVCQCILITVISVVLHNTLWNSFLLLQQHLLSRQSNYERRANSWSVCCPQGLPNSRSGGGGQGKGGSGWQW